MTVPARPIRQYTRGPCANTLQEFSPGTGLTGTSKEPSTTAYECATPPGPEAGKHRCAWSPASPTVGLYFSTRNSGTGQGKGAPAAFTGDGSAASRFFGPCCAPQRRIVMAPAAPARPERTAHATRAFSEYIRARLSQQLVNAHPLA